MAQWIKPQLTMDGEQRFEVMMLADKYGNLVGGANPSGTAVDAFGRARTSSPFTLFDSFHRYRDNGKITMQTAGAGAATHNANAGLIECSVGTASGDFVKRESSRVFAYQPGKSLQILQTFVFAAPKENLRQRFGYFGTQNGFFLEQDGTSIYLVRRSSSTGSVVETRIPQAEWNMDPLDGTGISKYTLDLTKAHILFTDIEWLGVGSVRMGFVIDGQLIPVHTFHHANSVETTYMSTACLPVRAEIENTGTTASSSVMKVICTSVISEGGYELRGKPLSFGMPITAPKDLPTAGTFTPIISIRLKDTNFDAIVIPTFVDFFAISNNTRYRYKIVVGGTLTGASWTSAGTESSVEYDTTATAISGGTDVYMGYVNIAAGQGGATVDLVSDKGNLFKYQLERNSFLASDKGVVFSLVATGAANGDDAIGAIGWEEVT